VSRIIKTLRAKGLTAKYTQQRGGLILVLDLLRQLDDVLPAASLGIKLG
jgi:hypothetical protein